MFVLSLITFSPNTITATHLQTFEVDNEYLLKHIHFFALALFYMMVNLPLIIILIFS
jgi:hypothetical protein